jgi:phenylacetate-coenzyme A ligase PaaK-like adenylate-forming protein
MKLEELKQKLFEINTITEFNEIALAIFHYQYAGNPVYRHYLSLMNTNIDEIRHFSQIPFLPVEFFKTHKIVSSDNSPEKIFSSSGTSGSTTSRHFVNDLSLYEKSFTRSFELFYGSPEDHIILALLPSYLERNDSSLVFMVEKLIGMSRNASSGFYLENDEQLVKKLAASSDKKILLLGVTYALLDLVLKFDIPEFKGIVMETGGMKGRRAEMIREELHEVLKSGFHVSTIHSEYGMTEMLSQAYSMGDGIFKTPPWMKILIRDTNDPKTLLADGKTGGINVIDLANLYSCSFIATQDLGKIHSNETFEVLGRFDNSDIRGCNLMVG